MLNTGTEVTILLDTHRGTWTRENRKKSMMGYKIVSESLIQQILYAAILAQCINFSSCAQYTRANECSGGPRFKPRSRQKYGEFSSRDSHAFSSETGVTAFEIQNFLPWGGL